MQNLLFDFESSFLSDRDGRPIIYYGYNNVHSQLGNDKFDLILEPQTINQITFSYYDLFDKKTLPYASPYNFSATGDFNDITISINGSLIYYGNVEQNITDNLDGGTYRFQQSFGKLYITNTTGNGFMNVISTPFYRYISSFRFRPNAWYILNSSNLGYDTQNNNHLTTSNNAIINTDVWARGNASTYFNGTDSYIRGTGVSLNTTGFFICFWVYLTRCTNEVVYGLDETSNDFYIKFITVSGVQTIEVKVGGFIMQTPTGIDVLNKWRFFGVQFYQVNSFLYVFKDTDTYVTNSISLTSLSSLNTLGTNYAIGRCNQNDSTCFHGYINDLKVYRGVTTLLSLYYFNQMRRYNIFYILLYLNM